MSAFRRPARRRLPVAILAVTACAALAVAPLVSSAAPTASAAIVVAPVTASGTDPYFNLAPLGTYETGTFDASAAEIVTYHAASKRLFVVNAAQGAVDVLDIADPTTPVKEFSLSAAGTTIDGGSSLIPTGSTANSVAVRADGLGAMAIESPTKSDAGWLVFFDANATTATILGAVTVGALPDMVSISADGKYAVSANEGEPNDLFTVDPEGSVSVVTLPSTLTLPASSAVATADFHAYESEANGGTRTLDPDVRIFGPTPEAGFPVSRNLEPEYVAIDPNSLTAYVALQEANAVAVVDLVAAEVTEVRSLGFQDHGLPGNGIDASDKDSAVNIQTYPGLHGMYMPDGMNAYTAKDFSTGTDATYLVTANEGDAREWGSYVEGARAEDLTICATSDLFGKNNDAGMGRLNVTKENGYNTAGTCYEELYSFGSRSFSIWDTNGAQTFDSGEDFERITAAANPAYFNSNHSKSNFEGRSDDKGPEPENLAIGEIDGRTYAFIGLERVGGIMAYDITDPTDAKFVTYLNNRNFGVDATVDLSAAGDLGPEGVTFISAKESPTGEPMLAVGNEVSGTTTIFSINVIPTEIQVLGINDFHGRLEANARNQEAGAAVLAGAVAQLKAKNPNTLFVSAGDNIGASTFTSFSQQDEPTITALLAAGLDASVVGNHEFDAGWDDLEGRVRSSFGDPRYALGANVYLKGTTTPALDEYWVKEVDGVRVGFIGTVTAATASLVSPAGIADIEFGDQLEAANRVAAQLQDGNTTNGEADVIVLLTHEGGVGTDCAAIGDADTLYGDLIRDASANIDAILSGHTHATYNCSYPVTGWTDGLKRPVMQSGQYGMNLDQLKISVDPVTKSVVSMTSALVDLHNGTTGLYPADATVAQIVTDAAAQADIVGSVEVGAISADIKRAYNGVAEDRGSESSLGNLVADIQLWATSNSTFGGEPAEIAFMNPGGVRTDLSYGENGKVTYKEVATVQPFANTLVTMDLTGTQLRTVLEQQWQSSRAKLHLGVSEGFSYLYEPDAALGEHIVGMSLNGVAIAPTDVFRVAVNSFLASGGDKFTTFAAGTSVADTGQADLAATVAYFEKHPLVDPASLGRAVLAGTDWASIDVGDAVFTPGERVTVTVSGLNPGQKVTGTLYSVPVNLGTFAANAAGVATFSAVIPASTPVGAHTLVISSVGLEPISLAVTVVAAASTSGLGAIPALGASLAPAGLAALLLLLGGGLILARRKRQALQA
ncbi:PEP-CTERM protein-sorting domain-containing protein [Cryobacterium flavum]|uniref:Bifunctional metallophosphatase/5'-nucleotidase n=1 Tax=Cryobacterium flavum TaxID=1424659 RepID=A0A4R8V654_9MICO|nr:choice-of-anchor I family protein [Cryobacterium flavum]TFB77768.1 bifunctional metallophosphatase/5'-nucleotidase [Cryobacterium flavum]SDM58609.1 PEP-CTERM protein-sorting domain-containing protein [Cryobacterium flavum]